MEVSGKGDAHHLQDWMCTVTRFTLPTVFCSLLAIHLKLLFGCPLFIVEHQSNIGDLQNLSLLPPNWRFGLVVWDLTPSFL